MKAHDVALDLIKEQTEASPDKDIVWKTTPVLHPGADWIDGVYYVTVPMTRMVAVEEGRGKAKKTVMREQKRTMVVTSERDWFWYDEDDLARNGFSMPPSGFLQQEESRWPYNDVRNYLTAQAEAYIDPVELYRDIQNHYRTYVEYTDDAFYELLPYYVMGSYLFRLFPSIGYLHFHGTAQSGKSQNLKLLKTLSFNCVWASNLSTASLFRHADGWPGLICIDEAESFNTERGEEIRRLLNAGYKAGEPVLRTEATGDGRFTVRMYDCYSPKALASINPLEPVVGSRCIVVPMQPALTPRSEFLESDARWGELRNRLYRWAMQSAPAVSQLYAEWNENHRHSQAASLRNRQWEISQVFVVLADMIHGRNKALSLIEFLNAYFAEQQKQQAETDRQLMLLKALPGVILDKTPVLAEYYALKDIHEVASAYLDEDQKEYYRTKQVSRSLSALGFRGRKSHKGGVLVHLTEDAIREQFNKRHVTPEDRDTAWLAGETYLHRSPSATPASASLWETEDDPDAGSPFH